MLRDSGRFAHRVAYVESLAMMVSLCPEQSDVVVVREERKIPVDGIVFALRHCDDRDRRNGRHGGSDGGGQDNEEEDDEEDEEEEEEAEEEEVGEEGVGEDMDM